MLDNYKKIKAFSSFAATALLFLSSGTVSAAPCSPGIPCTGYDIYSQPTAGTNSSYNGKKSGEWTSPFGSQLKTACDGNFMNQIYARAFLESQREVMLSEQIIHKPDSVLEYTCFDQFAGITKNQIDTMFSARQDWHNREVPLWTDGDSSDTVTINDNGDKPLPSSPPSYQTDFSVFETSRYDNILEDLLLDTIEEYIDSNFDHTFLGESITLDTNISTSSLPTSYSCAHMLAIWDIAKCIDFGEDDRFRSFNTLATADIRSIPKACPYRDMTAADSGNLPASTSQIASDVVQNTSSTKLDNTSSGEELDISVSMPGVSIPIPSMSLSTGGILTRMPSDGPIDDCPPAGGPATNVNTDISNDLIRLANNCDATSGSNTNIYSSTDLMKTYEHLIKGFGVVIPGTGTPSSPSAAAVLCSDPIPTGLPVLTYVHSLGLDSYAAPKTTRATFIHYDHICPNPGCYYAPVKQTYIMGSPLPLPTVFSAGQCLPSF